VLKAHRRLYHSTLGLRAIQKKTKNRFSHVPNFPREFPRLSPEKKKCGWENWQSRRCGTGVPRPSETAPP